MDTTTNLSGLHLSTLLTYHRDASDSAAVALPGTQTHALRVAWLGKLAAELARRENSKGGCIGDWSGKVVLCKAHGKPLAQCPAYTTSAASGNRAL